jgi:hypothetical protein
MLATADLARHDPKACASAMRGISEPSEAPRA